MERYVKVRITMESSNTKRILQDIMDSESNFEMVNKFLLNADYLDDYKIITISDKKNVLPEYFGYKKIDEKSGAGIYSIFLENDLHFIDKKVLSDYKTCNKATFKIDYTVSFDTQAVSYFDNMLKGKAIPETFRTALDFIIKQNLNIDVIPYIVENSSKLGNHSIREAMFDTLRSCQILRSLDKEYYVKYGKIRSVFAESENQRELDELIDVCEKFHLMYQTSGFDRFEYPFILLIVMTEIYLNSNKSSEKKTEDFLHYCHHLFHNLPLRIAHIANLFFSKQNNSIFFKKIQKGKDKTALLSELENMAWDLHHISGMEDIFPFYDNDSEKFVAKMILTFDRGLIELIETKPTLALAYSLKRSENFPIYAYTEEDDFLSKCTSSYLNSEAAKERAAKMLEQELDLKVILDKTKDLFLKGELLSVGSFL